MRTVPILSRHRRQREIIPEALRCPNCDGGEITILQRSPGGREMPVTCEYCDGTGRVLCGCCESERATRHIGEPLCDYCGPAPAAA